ncbi:hypothetical protein D9611_011657 [Ephemerocybe angulata]|uniref:RNase H type-1 domain-containing protein n=1 Tax=Ephemerocybe angulata TaxID=980116 RepID=A0A8H5FG41_9AGAR|nr:hypothetical protein D9611_011657 [Tulosesus angulatus]
MGDTLDVTGIRISGENGKLTIFSVYYDCTHNRTGEALRKYIEENEEEIYGDGGHVMWAGDFNRHHPMWDRDEDSRLFTRSALDEATTLIEFAEEWDMEQTLEKGIPTLEHSATKLWTRPDNVWLTSHSTTMLIECDTRHDLRPPMTDHIPIATILSIETTKAPTVEYKNFRETDWEEFSDALEEELGGIDTQKPITNETEFNTRVDDVTTAIQRTIEKVVPTSSPTSYTRRWWNKGLEKKRKEKQKLSRAHARFRDLPDHPSHQEYRDKAVTYANISETTKKTHWTEWLEDATPKDMWTANGYVKQPPGDGGRPRIPALKVKGADGTIIRVDTNERKAEELAKGFLIKKPEGQDEITTEPGEKLYELAPPLTINGTIIEKVKEYKYLGVIVDPELRWKAHTTRAAAKATQWVMMFRRLTKQHTGLSTNLMRQLYKAVGIPKMTYAADVWYVPPQKPVGGKKRVGSTDALRKLARVQRIAMIAITGAMGSTAGDVLDAHAGVEPMEVQLLTIHRRAFTRMCTLPKRHALATHIRQSHRRRDQKFANPTPIQIMARRYDINPTKVEKISLKMRPPNHERNFAIRIDESRQESIEHEKLDTAPIRIYTDGSGIDDKTGAAALLYRGEETEPEYTLHYHLGKKTDHSTYEAEWIGAILAVWILVSRRTIRNEVGTTAISIYTDNQSILKAMQSGRPGPAQYLQDEFYRLADALKEEGTNRIKFTLKWISAHSDVKRNEKVDEEAKKAARGTTTFALGLPPMLRPGLPRSISTLKEETRNEARKRWTELWRESKRGEGFRETDAEFPFKSYQKQTSQLTRSQNSLLVQIRTGHIPLNGYLFIRKKAETNVCQKCRSGKKETLEHFLYDCPAYRAQRTIMDREHGRDKRNMPKIMGKLEHVRALIRFTNRTGRFTLSRNGEETDEKKKEREKKRAQKEGEKKKKKDEEDKTRRRKRRRGR